MQQTPAAMLLERTHSFPCPYMFKVIGRPDNGFMARVVAAVRQELAAETDPPFRFRRSAGDRHIAVTLEPRVQSVQQVLAVYRRLRQTEGLVLLL